MMQDPIQKLQYSKDSLSPYISEHTINFHYDKHHRGYFQKLIDSNQYNSFDEALAQNNNNANQILLHNLQWKSLNSNGGKDQYNQNLFKMPFDEYKNQILNKGLKHFGSGWLWISINLDNEIEILTTGNAERIKICNRVISIIDLWEHAYYLDYQHDRKHYLEQIIDHLLIPIQSFTNEENKYLHVINRSVQDI